MPSKTTPAEALATMRRLLRDLAEDYAEQKTVYVELHMAADHVDHAVCHLEDAEASVQLVADAAAHFAETRN